jgi:putative flippase GtrA
MIDKFYKLILQLPEKIRFLLAGGFNTFTGYSVFLALHYMFSESWHYQHILVLTYILTSFCSFFTLKFFVFKAKGKWFYEYLRTLLSVSFIFFINAFSLYLLVEIFHIGVIVSQTVSIGITIVISYFAHKFFSFQMYKTSSNVSTASSNRNEGRNPKSH